MLNETNPTRRPPRWLPILLIGGAPCLVAGAFFHPFIRFDDAKYILQNPLVVEGLASSALEQVARPPAGDFKGYYGQYIPLTYFGLALQYWIHGAIPWAFRLVNLFFHIGSAWLLFQIIERLFSAEGAETKKRGAGDSLGGTRRAASGNVAAVVAALATLWFFFHPTNVETVAWAAQRNSAQALFFCLLAWRLQIAGRAGGTLIAYTAALLSKPLAIGFGPLLIVSEVLLSKRSRAQRGVHAGVLALLSFLAVLLAGRAGAPDLCPITGGSHFAWACTSLALVGRYVWQVLAPWNLSFFYGIAPVATLFDGWILLALVGVAGAVVVTRYSRAPWRVSLVLLAGALGALAVKMSPCTNAYLFQDRYLYFALPPLAAWLALVLNSLARKQPLPRSFPPLAAVAIALLAASSLLRSFDFRDSLELFQQAAIRQPASFMANFGTAEELLRHAKSAANLPSGERPRDFYAALVYVERARLAADADRFHAQGPLALLAGELDWRLKDSDTAEAALNAALAATPPLPRGDLAQAHWILAEIARARFSRDGSPESQKLALSHYQLVLKDYPAAPYALYGLAGVLEASGRKNLALPLYRQASVDPFYARAARAAIARLTGKN